MQLYSIFDVKAKDYLAPFEAPHDTGAVREVATLLSRNPETNRFVRHREDYTLVRLGEFDNRNTGMFESVLPTTITTLSAVYETFAAKQGGLQ